MLDVMLLALLFSLSLSLTHPHLHHKFTFWKSIEMRDRSIIQLNIHSLLQKKLFFAHSSSLAGTAKVDKNYELVEKRERKSIVMSRENNLQRFIKF
jgi:hypothetical protein